MQEHIDGMMIKGKYVKCAEVDVYHTIVECDKYENKRKELMKTVNFEWADGSLWNGKVMRSGRLVCY